MTAPTTLVLLPGLDGSLELAQPFVRAAAQHFSVRTVAYDIEPDQSQVGLAQRMAGQLPSDQPFVLVGESFGGPIALRLAAAAPKGLQAVVLVNSFLRVPVGWAQARALAALAPALRRPPAWVVRKLMVGDDASDVLVSSVQRAFAAQSNAVLQARLQALARCDETQSYLRCMAPMFYLRSRADRLLPERALSLLEYLRPGLVVEHIDAPHLLLQARPEAALACLRGWLLEDKGRA